MAAASCANHQTGNRRRRSLSLVSKTLLPRQTLRHHHDHDHHDRLYRFVGVPGWLLWLRRCDVATMLLLIVLLSPLLLLLSASVRPD